MIVLNNAGRCGKQPTVANTSLIQVSHLKIFLVSVFVQLSQWWLRVSLRIEGKLSIATQVFGSYPTNFVNVFPTRCWVRNIYPCIHALRKLGREANRCWIAWAESTIDETVIDRVRFPNLIKVLCWVKILNSTLKPLFRRITKLYNYKRSWTIFIVSKINGQKDTFAIAS